MAMKGKWFLGVVFTSLALLSGCVFVGDRVGSNPITPIEQPQEEEYLYDVEQAIISSSPSVSDVSAEQTLSGLSQELSLVVVVPEGEISTADLFNMLVAIETFKPDRVDMIKLYVVDAFGESSSSVSVGAQLVEIGIPESWIINDGFATIPVSVLETVTK